MGLVCVGYSWPWLFSIARVTLESQVYLFTCYEPGGILTTVRKKNISLTVRDDCTWSLILQWGSRTQTTIQIVWKRPVQHVKRTRKCFHKKMATKNFKFVKAHDLWSVLLPIVLPIVFSETFFVTSTVSL